MEKKKIRYEKPILEQMDAMIGIGQGGACSSGSAASGACGPTGGVASGNCNPTGTIVT